MPFYFLHLFLVQKVRVMKLEIFSILKTIRKIFDL